MPLTNKDPSGPVVIISKDIVFAFPFGIAYLAGYLREKGEDVRVLFKPNVEAFYKSFVKEIIALKPLVVGFGSLYPDLYEVKKLIKLLDQSCRTFPIVIGGQMVSPTPEFAVEITGADYGVIGEGEIIFHDLVTSLRQKRDTGNIRGLAIRDGKEVRLTGQGDYIKDMSQLPPIPYDLFPSEKWLNIGKFYARYGVPHWRYNDRVVSIHGGRGCPYNCNFCYHHSKPRYRPITDMMTEANELIDRYDANMLYFGDDLVLANPNRAAELTEAIAQLDRPIEYSVSCRFDILSRMDDALLREMKRTGCRIMGLGIESGSQRILDIMNKRITVEQIKDGLRRLKNVGILPTVSIMVGQLSETEEDVNKSMSLLLETVRNDKRIQYAFTITTPFPGSDLYDAAFKKGILKKHSDFYDRFSPSTQMSGLSVNLSDMDDKTVIEMRQKLEAAFYEEILKLRGKKVMIIEAWRNDLAGIDSRLRGIYLIRLPKVIREMVLRPHEWVYDFIQSFLDRWRLRMLGIG